jgi:hypothetical protein
MLKIHRDWNGRNALAELKTENGSWHAKADHQGRRIEQPRQQSNSGRVKRVQTGTREPVITPTVESLISHTPSVDTPGYDLPESMSL